MSQGKRISLKLTPEQQQQIKQATGKDAAELNLDAAELEDRVAPMMLGLKLS